MFGILVTRKLLMRTQKNDAEILPLKKVHQSIGLVAKELLFHIQKIHSKYTGDCQLNL